MLRNGGAFDSAKVTPYELIRSIEPDILVKGGDYRIDTIVGADLVTARGGDVRVLSFKHGNSTTGLVERIVNRHSGSTE